MSAAAAATSKTDAAEAVPVKKGKKKLILIGAALAVLLAGGGGAAVYVMKKRAADAAAAAAEGEEGEDGGGNAAHGSPIAKADLKHAPAFVPLEMFTVNLADRDAERYAQVGITLELVDAKAGDLLKAYMPAIRNNILLVLAGKQAGDLMDHQGKLQLAAEIRAAALKPLGYIVEVPRPSAASAAESGHDEGKPKSRAKAAPEDPETPVRAVHFSNFIIQ